MMCASRIFKRLCHSTRIKEPEVFPGGHSIRTKRVMLNYLKKNRLVQSVEVARVMDKIDRALFVREGTPPYMDCHQPIGYGSCIFTPLQTALTLEFLRNNLKPGMCALDVGSGSGYLTACFAHLVGKNGRAVGVEITPELVDFSRENIEKSEVAPLLRQGSLSLHVGDGRKGWEEFAPYDAINVGFVAPEIYPALIEQLKTGGRLAIYVAEGASASSMIVDKKSDGSTNVWFKTKIHTVHTDESGISVSPL